MPRRMSLQKSAVETQSRGVVTIACMRGAWMAALPTWWASSRREHLCLCEMKCLPRGIPGLSFRPSVARSRSIRRARHAVLNDMLHRLIKGFPSESSVTWNPPFEPTTEPHHPEHEENLAIAPASSSCPTRQNNR